MAQVSVTAAQAGQTINAHVGDEIVLTLPENRTTGFRWAPLSSGEPVLRQIDSRYTPMSGGGVGAGGESLIRFHAASPGEARLSLVLRQEWQPDDIADRFAVRIVVDR